MDSGDIFPIMFGLLCVVFVAGLTIAIFDAIYYLPVASQNANNFCKANGFDQYKEFSRIGIWSTNPVGIKCEYAERYTDLGVRTTGSNGG